MGTRAAFLIFPVLLTYVSGLPPLVVVPGLLGSQLQAKLDKPNVVHSYCSKTSDWYTLWLNVEQLLPFVINCFVDNARYVYTLDNFRCPSFTVGDTLRDLVIAKNV
jgi:lysophospholipase-3